jgi:hypothetical protein
LEFTIGNFSYKEYTVSITYDDGTTEQLALTEDMIPETDKLKFYQEGKNSITISCKGAETSVEINVLRNRFSDTIQLNDFTATYTGKPYIVEVEGDIPGNAEILYPQGNTFENAGSYDMTAIVQCDGYETKILSAQVRIEKASYDVANAQLYNETVTYNKDAHYLTVKGKAIEDINGEKLHGAATLPQGVSVSYTITKVKDGTGKDIPEDKQQFIEGNKAVDAGTYKVCARFKGDASNYNPIPDSVAYLTIDRATYDMSKIEFLDVTATYSGEAHAVSIAQNSKLPSDVVVSYQIKQLKNGAGETVTDTYKDGNTEKNAGVYLVKASFSISGKNAENYTTAPLEKEAYLTIRRASYDEGMKNLYFDAQWNENKGKYEIRFDGELPEGVTPKFTLTSNSGESVQVETQRDETADKPTEQYFFEAKTEGEYTCVVTFTHTNENYDKIKVELNALFYISKIV